MTIAADQAVRDEPARIGSFTLLMRTRPEVVLAPVLFVVIIALWEWAVPYFQVPNWVLPTPSQIPRRCGAASMPACSTAAATGCTPA
jgi:ABC-type nitrate/sulfonate/bicarbonate transport system permease component